MLLVVFYLYGFTTYSFNMADLEEALEGRVGEAIIFAVAAVAVLAWSWRRRPAPSEVIFDASEPLIQTLNLN